MSWIRFSGNLRCIRIVSRSSLLNLPGQSSRPASFCPARFIGLCTWKRKSLFGKIPQVGTLLLIFIFIGLLSIYGIKGTYSRYAQDDYCYGYKVRDMGFWNMQIQSYMHINEFNSDRYSLTIAHSLVELSGGPKTVPVLPTLEILACTPAWFLFFTRSGGWSMQRRQPWWPACLP